MIHEHPYVVVPFVLLIGALLLFRTLGVLGVRSLQSWKLAARYALATMFVFTSASHFTGTRADLVRMVPDVLPYPELLVTVTGVLELLGAVGLLRPATARYAGLGLALLLVAMFPANVVASQEGLAVAGKVATPLWFRFFVQVVFISMLLWATSAMSYRRSDTGPTKTGPKPR
ncbi:DoxX family protein [Natronorubrum halophilum]|uniref:DoxX family protein n=1 Tax=Natronorubrum halophilum TaxID=1702106 RepID=UPI000EF748E8|nr:DoxX family protein [Natronorubrum halophilum]